MLKLINPVSIGNVSVGIIRLSDKSTQLELKNALIKYPSLLNTYIKKVEKVKLKEENEKERINTSTKSSVNKKNKR